MKLYLIRHGESEANKKGVHNTPEVKLTKDGVRQARAIAKRLKNMGIDFIYSSPLTRARQTAEAVSKSLGLPIEFWENIAEVKTPSINRGKSESNKDAMKIESEIAKNYSKGKWKHSDEETFNEIRARAQGVLDHILKKHGNQNVLCVSHASFIKMITLVAIVDAHLTPNVYLRFREHSRNNNSGVTILEHTQKSSWVLDTWNDTNHL